MKKIIVVLVIAALGFSACSSQAGVTRVDSSTQIDLSGYWNDTDVRIVCEALIKDCLSSARVDQAIKAIRKTPVVIVGRFKNDSSEHIDTGIISTTMETVIFNSGKMDFVAGGATRDALRAERNDQQGNASELTAAALANETGANFMLTGTVNVIEDRAGNTTVRSYFVTAELTNIETNSRFWMGENSEIKKVITRPRTRI